MGIEYTTDGAVATFTIANGTHNPLTPAMHRQMATAMREFLADDSVKVGILTGAGDRAFCAGDDIKHESLSSGSVVTDLLGAMGAGPAHEADADPAGWDAADAVLRMERTKPIVGAVRGWCLGRGLAYLVHLTDLRVCSPDARFGLPEIAYGMGGLAGTMRLARHVPPAIAWEMALTGNPIDAAEAHRVGLVNRVVPGPDLAAEARRLADDIARHPAIAIRTELESLRRSQDLDADDAYAMGFALYRAQRLALGESDVQPSFLYKR